MPNDCIAFYEPGSDLTVEATEAITGKRFAKLSGRQSGPGLSAEADGGNYDGAIATAGQDADGVFAYDAASGDKVGVKAGPGSILPVTAGAAIDAGEKVAVGALGKAVPWDEDGTPASLVTGTVGANNAIAWTSRLLGDEGEEITITIVDPAGNNVALSVDVDGRDIVVTGATDGASALTSTAALVIAAIQEDNDASQLVDVANSGASTGAGVVLAVAETPLAGGVDVAAQVGTCMADVLTNGDAEVRLFH